MHVELFNVCMAELQPHIDPLGGALWGCDRIQPSEVLAAMAANKLEERTWDREKDELQGPGSRDFHVRRVAYFVAMGLPNDSHRIRLSVDALDPSQPIRIDNGNHRLAAAIIRGDAIVQALLYHFDRADVARFLPSAVLVSGAPS